MPAFHGLCNSLVKHSSLWKQYFSVSSDDLYFMLCLVSYISIGCIFYSFMTVFAHISVLMVF